MMISKSKLWVPLISSFSFAKNLQHLPSPKKLICISPGGFKGFYMFGICKYIHRHYNLDNCLFSGASAGAWSSLFISYKGSLDELQKHLLDDSVQQSKSVIEMENLIKKRLLTYYTSHDFHLDRLYIGVTTIRKYHPETTIFSQFDSLEDVIDCCIASSHIPFVTGNVFCKYKNNISFDGGFSKYPFLNSQDPTLLITPNMWNPNKKNKKMTLQDYTTLLSKDKYDFQQLIQEGYLDSFENKEYIDNVLLI